ncbi:hypothetical protein C8Q76DRAFT_796703 [Earliella scabrosa]|nr:hypothetical protein C8Q76DRAFT_796703 [Earliella scabrosa]
MVKTVRTEFTERDDDLLAQYIAKYNPQKEGRTGNALYKQLEANVEGKWAFAKRHSWQSWRERYRTNEARFDRLITKHIKKFHRGEPSQPSAPVSQQPSTTGKRVRVPFTAEDDQNLVEFLASCDRNAGTRGGQKLYMRLQSHDDYPWASRHPWQSWRERYQNNQDWFNWAVHKFLADEHEAFDDPEPPRPKTSDDILVRKKPSQRVMAEAATLDKRKRDSAQRSASEDDAPPRKKSRIQEPAVQPAQRPVAGPSKRRDTAPEHIPQKADVEAGGAQRRDADIGAGSKSRRNASDGDADAAEEDSGSEEDDEDVEEDLGPPGPEDYHGEIFGSPTETEDSARVPKRRTTPPSDSSEEREELYGLLEDSVQQEHDGEDGMDDDGLADRTLIGQAGAADHGGREEPRAGEDVPVLSKTPPSGASPPARRHIERIERNIEAGPATSSVSPTEAADKRHRRGHAHSPAPPRKHPKRIRKAADEDFFGTPKSSQASSSSGDNTAIDSPTAEHVAHVRAQRHQDDAEGTFERPREPPQLHEGPWNKALSDGRRQPRVSPSGKSRRKSGVDFEEEAEVIGTQDEFEGVDEGENKADEDNEQASPTQWPPVRRKDSKTTVPVTPTHPPPQDKGKARELVTTERIVSVKTVRTVKHRVPRASNGTPYVRSTVPVDGDDAVSPEVTEPAGRREPEPEPSQHHPFSQPTIPPRMAASHSNDSTRSGSSHSTTNGVFPRVNPDVPLSKVHMSSFQRMLQRDSSPPKATYPQSSPSKAERDAKLAATGRLSAADRRIGAKRAAVPLTALARETMSPPGRLSDDSGERFSRFDTRDEDLPVVRVPPTAQSSPLQMRHDRGRGDREVFNELGPIASTSRSQRIAHGYGERRTDRGNVRPSPPSSAIGHARRHTLGGPEAHDTFSETDSVRRTRASFRQSLPSHFSIGDDLRAHSTALSLLFNPHRSGSSHTRSYSLSRSSTSPARSVDASLVDTLPPNELELVKEIGMQSVLRIMADNHGFSEETVRQVYAQTRSLEVADHVLREMRIRANDAANDALESLVADEEEEEEEDEDRDDDGDVLMRNEDAEEDGGESGSVVDDPEDDDEAAPADRNGRHDEAEVERFLDQGEDSWLQNGGPQAESSRLDASHREPVRVSVPRRQQVLHITPVEPGPEATRVEPYSPPKHTRALRDIKRKSVDASRTVQASDTRSPAAMRQNPPTDVSLGQLARLTPDQWRSLGPTGVKIATGKALGKLLELD